MMFGNASIAAVALSLGLLAACANLPAVSSNVRYCCLPEVDAVSTYRIEFSAMPEFLKPMLRDEVSIALDQKAIRYTESEAAAVLTMTFVNTPIPPIAGAEADEAWGNIAPGGIARFNAVVEMELRNAVTRELLWAGSMSRLHSVGPGSYMHEAPARRAIRNALLVLFEGLPGPR